MYATLLLSAGLTSRTSIAYKDEEKLLQNASDADLVYIKEVLPAKMKYNLESLRKFGLLSDMSVLWDTFLSVIRRG
jgi:lipopolysaccharide/colanic/teichoic acid biosynthesis glycosyltransferase